MLSWLSDADTPREILTILEKRYQWTPEAEKILAYKNYRDHLIRIKRSNTTDWIQTCETYLTKAVRLGCEEMSVTHQQVTLLTTLKTVYPDFAAPLARETTKEAVDNVAPENRLSGTTILHQFRAWLEAGYGEDHTTRGGAYATWQQKNEEQSSQTSPEAATTSISMSPPNKPTTSTGKAHHIRAITPSDSDTDWSDSISTPEEPNGSCQHVADGEEVRNAVFVDTSASDSLSWDRSRFQHIQPVKKAFDTPNGPIQAVAKGSLIITAFSPTDIAPELAIPNAYLNPQASTTLISTIKLEEQDLWFSARKRCFEDGDGLQFIKQLVNFLNTQYGIIVRFIRLDGDMALQTNMDTFTADEGIMLERTAPYTSAQNGSGERAGGVVFNDSRAMRIESNFPPDLWPEITAASVYVGNLTPRRKIHWKTPQGVLNTWLNANLTLLEEAGSRITFQIIKIPTRKFLILSLSELTVTPRKTNKKINRQARTLRQTVVQASYLGRCQT
ncbi:hypothetical protein CKAH01_06587 [Colletotrichum kahawae]|uniref:Integrase catalytic domain-containing protein n=1 Tax=Colletotrichum kahawae TaxID=34407 RepID=A0AAE0D391_COLKA|nr:hypothetical protein CKAH01_06587 [Colletotrichum kahawae]